MPTHACVYSILFTSLLPAQRVLVGPLSRFSVNPVGGERQTWSWQPPCWHTRAAGCAATRRDARGSLGRAPANLLSVRGALLGVHKKINTFGLIVVGKGGGGQGCLLKTRIEEHEKRGARPSSWSASPLYKPTRSSRGILRLKPGARAISRRPKPCAFCSPWRPRTNP